MRKRLLKNKMKTRIITAIIILSVIIPTFMLSGTVVYPIVLSALAVRSVFEMLRVFGFDKSLAVCIPSYLLAFCLPTVAFFHKGDVKDFFMLCLILVYFYMLYLLMVSVVTRAKVKFSQLARVFCAISYVTFAFAALAIIRYINNGAYFFAISFICAWVSDVFALLVGKLIGKHQLIPEISPKKTVEGSIGGIVFATIAMLLYGFLLDRFVDTLEVNYLVLGVMGLVLAIVSQGGDLIASTIKREGGVKDYGHILPGHGGVTDRFDSIYAVAVLALVICVVFPPFV